jgi:predicted AlkP superfamily pyrophosphatase or phosphodiesterase
MGGSPLRPTPSNGGLLQKAAVAAALLGVVLVSQSSSQTAASPRPRLVLFVSVDQMRADYLTRFEPLFQGGFKRLRERGAIFTNALYRHANTETGPGHALLLSGRHGRDNGIIANEWYERDAGGLINVVHDPVHVAVPGPGRGASPANFMGYTIGDLLKKASSASRVVGVAMKDRSAVLMGGRRADAAYWYEPKAGRFGSSTYYLRELPDWLSAWNASGRIDKLNGQTWTRALPDEALYQRYAGPDDVRGEWDNVDTVFPHKVRGGPASPEFYDDLRRTPFADELVLEVALLAMQAHDLGTDEATDLLAVGFSATDLVGHTYGADSQELMDQILRLDRTVGALIDAAEKRAGPEGLLVGLSADHGALPLVELLQQRGLPARRSLPHELDDPVRKALAARFPGADDLIAAFAHPNFYLDLDAIARRGLKRADVERAIEQALMATGLVERVYTHERLLGDPPADDPAFTLFRNSFFEPRSPQVIVGLKPYVYMEYYQGGSGHGTHHEYDRHVALALMGPRVAPGRYAGDCGPEDIAPTLAELLGLPYRVEPDQRVLNEALKP